MPRCHPPHLPDKCSKTMMIGELPHRSSPTVQIPSWDPLDEPTSPIVSPFAKSSGGNAGSPFLDSLTALYRFLPSNNKADSLSDELEFDLPVDAFSCDHFRMYVFKIRRCPRGRSHDWTECPYAHPGEKARRRDPRKIQYSGTACPDFRKGCCKKGDACEFAHGVFECWLHPYRYRTQPCKDGRGCRRRVCFFAHTPEQLRVSPQQGHGGNGTGSGESDLGSLLMHHVDCYLTKKGSLVSSPTSILTSPPMSPPSDSPPISPTSPQIMGGSFNSGNDLVGSMRALQLGKMKMGPANWGVQTASGLGSPRGQFLRSAFCSLPSTPTQTIARPGLRQFDIWESKCEEEPAMERVESGRDIRAKIYAKLSKENSLERSDSGPSAPDVGWVSELVK